MRALSHQVFNDNWPIRRRWLRVSLIWMALNVQAIVILTVLGYEQALLRDLAVTMLGAIVTLISAYAFGSCLDDNSKRRWMRRRDDDDDVDDEKPPIATSGDFR